VKEGFRYMDEKVAISYPSWFVFHLSPGVPLRLSTLLSPAYVITVAAGFGGWPVFARYSGMSSAWSTVVLMTATAVLLPVFQWSSLRSDPLPTARGIGFVLIGAVLNTLALKAFGTLLTSKPELVAVCQVLMPVVTMVGMIVFFGDPLPFRHIVGLVVVSVGIYLLVT